MLCVEGVDPSKGYVGEGIIFIQLHGGFPPLVGTVEEYRELAKRIHAVGRAVPSGGGRRLDYQVGTMIEIPRACLIADKIAAEAEFFSFGTNDLTQMTYGYSRDDVAKFLPDGTQRELVAIEIDSLPCHHLVCAWTVGVTAYVVRCDRGRAQEPGDQHERDAAYNCRPGRAAPVCGQCMSPLTAPCLIFGILHD